MRKITRYSIRALLILMVVASVGLLIWQNLSFPLKIVAAPRPNSGTYTTQEARTELPKVLAKTRGINVDDDLIKDWKNPTFGFHVHIDRNDKVLVTGPLGEKSEGTVAVKQARDLALSFLDGNPASVLLTSETNGWNSSIKDELIELLFEPAIQIYVVHRQ